MGWTSIAARSAPPLRPVSAALCVIGMDEELRLSAQRALLGCITGGLRAVSVEKAGNTIKWQCAFESEAAKAAEWEVLSEAATEVIADYAAPAIIEEDYVVMDFRSSGNETPNQIAHLKNLVFLRYESGV